MIPILTWALAVLILVTAALSAVNSFTARRTTDPVLRGLLTARMNINMGLMLVSIAFIQMLLYSGSSLRVVVGAVFILLGLFNLFAGLRNRAHFKRLSQQQT